jgi:CRISPR-associated endonuclease/helicase Cas3
MDSIGLDVLPVYSLYHSDIQVGPTRLLKHQVETWEAFRDPKTDVIFNVAMTGDGKSLAAYLPAFQEERHILAMYPTNELIYDQYISLSKYERSLNMALPRSDFMHSPKINRVLREHDETRRFEEVRKFLIRNKILLTNPDLVHLMLSHQYGWDYQRKELAVTAGSYFDYFLFDESHVFGIPQVISVMNMLGYLLASYREKPAERKKFVFLSATPNNLLTSMLDRGGIRYKVIQGSYISTASENYRCILQPCRLHFHEVSQDASTEHWVKEHVEDIRRFFHTHPGSKAAILVYSVATARRLVTFLRAYFRPYGIEVGENSGLASREERQESYRRHILVGTSTVDIGVDFHINYLIFEASSAGSFLQRFGRLGRHEGFEVYEAHALLPRFVLERLRKKYTADQEVERERLNEVIREVFPLEQEFEGYTRRWGVVQAAQILAELEGQKKRDATDELAAAVQEHYERFYGGAGKQPVMPRAVKKYWALRAPGHAPEIVDELSSFRGQSPLSCGIWDTDDKLKTYDLFFLLANASVEVLTQEAFLQEVRRRGLDEREFHHKHFYLRVWEYVDERQSLILGLRHHLIESTHILHQAVVLDDFFVREPRLPWLNDINRRLKQLRLVCLISLMPRDELRQRLKLGGIFPIYRLRDGWGQDYSVAFGEEALLLDSLLFYRKTEDDRAMML